MRRAAKYRRISRDREGRELGIERQDEDLDLLARRLGVEVVASFWDNDISASTNSKKPRRGYEQMLQAARAGEFQVVLAYTTGRLTRRPREHEDLIDLAVQHGIEFEYVRSPSFDLSTAAGRRIARTLAAQDAGEAEDIAERLIRQKRQAAESGEWRGGRRPYGYGPVVGADPITKEPIVDCNKVRHDEAEDIAWGTRETLTGGSMRSQVLTLAARGRTTSAGGPWTTTQWRRCLMRARNAGLVEVTQPDGSTEVVGQAVWPAIVSEPEWRAVCAILRDPGRRTNSTNLAKRWLGSNLYLCGICEDGTTVTSTSTGTGRGRKAWHYSCRHFGHVIRRADYVDKVVEAEVLGWLGRPEAAAHLAVREQPNVTELQAQLKTLQQRLDDAADLFAAGDTDKRGYARMTSPVKAEIEAVKGRLAVGVTTSPLAGIVGADDIEAAWNRLDISKRQAVVDTVVHVVLMPGRKGRPAGWRKGEPYFDPESVDLRWLD